MQPEHAAVEIKRLQRCISDLISVLALPAMSSGGEPSQIAHTLLDSLLPMLHLDFVYARLTQRVGDECIELIRTADAQTAEPSQLGKVFDDWLHESPQKWPRLIRDPGGEGEIAIVPLRLGLHGELSLLVAGSHRPDFPAQTERLVLSVAANQAAIDLQGAWLLSEQRRVARELDQRVAQRTAELAAANDELRKEVVERRQVEEALRTSETNLRRIIDERKRAEEALRRSEARLADSERDLQLTIDTIPVFVATYRPDGTRSFVNRTWQEYMGLTLEEATRAGAKTFPHFHPADAELNDKAWRASLEDGEPLSIEVRVRRADGQYRWHTSRRVPLRDEKGDVVKWYSVGIDIEDQKVAEDALRLSEARLAETERELRKLINTIPVLAWCNLPDGSNEFLNQPWHDYTGLPPEESHGWGWQVTIHPDDLPGLLDEWRELLDSGEPGEIEARLRRFDGVYRWFLFRVNPLRDESGGIVKWYGTNTDIDDRKRAEEELRRNEAFLAEGQRLSLTGSFSWRASTDEITWSEQLYRIFEFDQSVTVTLELIGTRVHPEDIPLLNDMIDRARGAASDFEYEHRLQMPDHSVKYVHLVAHATRDKESRLEYIGAVQDVTQRRFSEEALGKARSELAHVARVMSLGALTASIAHEVNQPLSGIVTNASTCLRMLAADPPNVDGARETARRTLRDGNRASDVITRLRALFAKKETAAESVDLNEAAREVIALSLSELQRSRVILRPELADELPPLTGDRVQLQQVILNLLLNASDAMSGVEDRPRQLVIRTEREESDRVRLSVQDAGVGFEPQGMEKLFEAFYSTKRNGMGIGLSISRSIIESHHGRLWAAPNDGPGATFSFSIPRESWLATSIHSFGATRTSAATDAAHSVRDA